jgi:hypothetical protein
MINQALFAFVTPGHPWFYASPSPQTDRLMQSGLGCDGSVLLNHTRNWGYLHYCHSLHIATLLGPYSFLTINLLCNPSISYPFASYHRQQSLDVQRVTTTDTK